MGAISPRSAAMLRRHGERRLTDAWNTVKHGDLDGLEWYPNAHRWCVEKADRYGYTPTQVAGIVAALSPRTGWGRNLYLAEEAMKGVDMTTLTLSRNASKAMRIAQGENPDDVVSGNKTRSFWRNLSGDFNPVTLDTHSGSLASGRDYNADGAHFLERKGVYAVYEQAHQNVAWRIGMQPAVFQAVLWVPRMRGEI